MSNGRRDGDDEKRKQRIGLLVVVIAHLKLSPVDYHSFMRRSMDFQATPHRIPHVVPRTLFRQNDPGTTS
jgi:hypothetical protein